MKTKEIKTLRDTFAISFTTGVLSDYETIGRYCELKNPQDYIRFVAEDAYIFADLMLKERKKKRDEKSI